MCRVLYYGITCNQRQLIENSMAFAYATLLMLIFIFIPVFLFSKTVGDFALMLSLRFEPHDTVDGALIGNSRKRTLGSLLYIVLSALDVAGNILRVLINSWLLTASLRNLYLKPPDAFRTLAEAFEQSMEDLQDAIPFIPFPYLGEWWDTLTRWFEMMDEWVLGIVSAAEVTCEGATLPLRLFFNLSLIIFVVVLIESNAEIAIGAKARLTFAGTCSVQRP